MRTRRDALGLGAAAGLAALLPGWARGQGLSGAHPSQTTFDLTIDETPFHVAGRTALATTINGGVPGPLLRWREGEEVTLRVHNRLREDTSLHWHGLLLPNAMDGVPGVTFDGIAPGATFEYRFPVRQAGTYWYHSHSGFQEQTGVYGPIVIDPAAPERAPYDREHVIVLSDWSFLPPDRIYAALKKEAHYFNYQRPTLFGREPVEGRGMWARMRMSPADLSDVTGATYSFLINGAAPDAMWTGMFTPGERVRLRIINAAAMTMFDLRIPGLPMIVVNADGVDVKPVETDELRISVAETYDVIITPGAGAYTLFAEALDRSGFACGTLTSTPGLTAAIPAPRRRALRPMADMGMDHAAHGDHAGHGAPTQDAHAGHDDHSTSSAPEHAGHADHGAHGMSGHDGHHGHADHSAHAVAASAPAPEWRGQAHDHRMGPGVDAVPAMTASRLHEPGIGLGEDGWRVLTYADLESAVPNRDPRAPTREVELHLTGNMERFVWGFDGDRMIDAHDPIVWTYGERLRLTLVNDTMMEHPIHLHGMFMELENGAADRPLKHTINVKPAERLSLLITADEPGDWAFHCHLLYHMEAGMMRVITVTQPDGDHDSAHAHHGAHAGHGHHSAPMDHSGHDAGAHDASVHDHSVHAQPEPSGAESSDSSATRSDAGDDHAHH